MYKCLRTDIKIAYFKDLHCEVRGGGGVTVHVRPDT